MAYEYGCFISHVGAREALMTEFVESLVEALRSELEPYVPKPVFIDEDGMRTGAFIDPTVAHAMCASACWILVYVPQFWEHEYCLRELQAMLDLEAARREELDGKLDRRVSMIIPVLLRGELAQLPAGIGRAVHTLPFNGYSTAKPNILRNSAYIDRIREVAAYVHEIYKLGKGLTHDCTEFVMPAAPDDLGSPPPPLSFPGDPPGPEVMG